MLNREKRQPKQAVNKITQYLDSSIFEYYDFDILLTWY